jgi:hypothetical protein
MGKSRQGIKASRHLLYAFISLAASVLCLVIGVALEALVFGSPSGSSDVPYIPVFFVLGAIVALAGCLVACGFALFALERWLADRRGG